jgi:hypothetical protein
MAGFQEAKIQREPVLREDLGPKPAVFVPSPGSDSNSPAFDQGPETVRCFLAERLIRLSRVDLVETQPDLGTELRYHDRIAVDHFGDFAPPGVTDESWIWRGKELEQIKPGWG